MHIVDEKELFFIENFFIMPVTLLHQWEGYDNTMTKNPNAGENFKADWMDASFPAGSLVSWVYTGRTTSPLTQCSIRLCFFD